MHTQEKEKIRRVEKQVRLGINLPHLKKRRMNSKTNKPLALKLPHDFRKKGPNFGGEGCSQMQLLTAMVKTHQTFNHLYFNQLYS